MKLGPCHLIRDATYQDLHKRITDQAAKLALQFPIHTYQHLPVNVRVGLAVINEPDPPGEESRQAAARVMAAYQKARQEIVPSRPGVWDEIEGRHRWFLEALDKGAGDTVEETLRRMFRTDLLWGLGRLHPSVPEQMERPPSDYQQRVTDTLVSLAEAVAATGLPSAEQRGVEACFDALNVDLDQLLHRIETRTGLDVSFPAVGGSYGVRVAGRMVSMDSLTHGYAVHRLRQLGARKDSALAEIGGGYGCLAWLFYRNGFRNYTIYDLPWVNVLQGYFLIRTLPPGTVRLHGETDGDLKVLPHWGFHQLPDRSVDHVVNTNSLPEMHQETARQYLARIRRVLRGLFFSVNQEARNYLPGYGPQTCVNQLVEEVGGFRLLSRSRYWMFPGYAEEVFALGQDHEN